MKVLFLLLELCFLIFSAWYNGSSTVGRSIVNYANIASPLHLVSDSIY